MPSFYREIWLRELELAEEILSTDANHAISVSQTEYKEYAPFDEEVVSSYLQRKFIENGYNVITKPYFAFTFIISKHLSNQTYVCKAR